MVVVLGWGGETFPMLKSSLFQVKKSAGTSDGSGTFS
jgi:hypothetical protein